MYKSLAVLFLISLALAGQGQTTEKPNIILIFADDLGYKDLGMNGSDFYVASCDFCEAGRTCRTDESPSGQ